MDNVNRKLVNMYELISCLTNACDLVSPKLGNHHQQVAYLAYHIGKQMNLPRHDLKHLMLAGLLHDVGALSFSERHELVENEPPNAQDHAFRGAKLLEGFEPLAEPANIIRFHHVPWNHGEGSFFSGMKVSVFSHIIHVADRIAVLIKKNTEVLGQVKSIVKTIDSQRNTKFMPELIDAFLQISTKESIWLDLVNNYLHQVIPNTMVFDTLDLGIDDTIKLTKIFANIIDFRSPFTAYHSVGVATTAEKLAELAGFSEEERKMMLVAGYLHDLGKLAVNNEVLEKPSKLDVEEYNIIRSHPYYTFRLLQPIKAFELINIWASSHHEKLNGQGYPFQLIDENISLGSRIMAVADIFTAITENRPYRQGMLYTQTVDVLNSLVKNDAICSYVVSILTRHYDEINSVRQTSQDAASIEYNYFMDYSDKTADENDEQQ